MGLPVPDAGTQGALSFNARSDIHTGGMKGLCHRCLSSGVELTVRRGEVLCRDCADAKN